jgi:serine/threonine protein kinase
MKLISLGECVSYVDSDLIAVGGQIVSSAFLPPELFSSHSSTSSAATLLAHLPGSSVEDYPKRPATSQPPQFLYPNQAKYGEISNAGIRGELDPTGEADQIVTAPINKSYSRGHKKSLCTKTGLSFDERDALVANFKKSQSSPRPQTSDGVQLTHPSDNKSVVPSLSVYDLHDRKPLGEYSLATTAIDMWSLGATLYALCAGETLFLSSVDDAIDSLQLTMLADWTDGLKEQRIARVHDCFARTLLNQLLHKDPSRRPSIQTVLKHPFLTQRPPSRYEGMPADYDVCIIYRSKQRNPVKKVVLLEDDGESLVTESNSDDDSGVDQQATVLPAELSYVEKLEICEHIHVQWLTRLLQERGLRVTECDSNCNNLLRSRCAVVVLSRFAINIKGNDLNELIDESNDNDELLLKWRVALELPAFGILENGIICLRVGDRSDVCEDVVQSQSFEDVDMSRAVANRASVNIFHNPDSNSLFPRLPGVQKNQLDMNIRCLFNYEPPDRCNAGTSASYAKFQESLLPVEDVHFGHYFKSYRGDTVGRFGGCHPASLPTLSLSQVDAKLLKLIDEEGFGSPMEPRMGIAELVKLVSTSQPFDLAGDATVAWMDAANFIAVSILSPRTVLPVQVRINGYSTFNTELNSPCTGRSAATSPVNLLKVTHDMDGGMTSRPFTASGVRPLSPLSPELLHTLGVVDTEIVVPSVDDAGGNSAPEVLILSGQMEVQAKRASKGLRVIASVPSRPGTSHGLRGDTAREAEQDLHFTAVAFSDNNAAMASTIALLEEKIIVREMEANSLAEELNRTKELMKIRMMELNALRAQSNMKGYDTL